MTALFSDDWGLDQRHGEVDRWYLFLNSSIRLSECGYIAGKLFAGFSLQMDNPETSPSPFAYTAICGQQKTSTLDPSGAGSQSVRISLPKRFWPLTSAHVAHLNGSQMVRNRCFWVRSDPTQPCPTRAKKAVRDRECQILWCVSQT